jgi:hypothetical protein
MTEDKNLQSVNFSDRNAVEKFLETAKFRPCAHLKCLPAGLKHGIVYMPVCLEGRFNKTGVADFIEMPLPPRPLSPLTYTTIGVWAPLVSCPPDCKGYRNRALANMQNAVRLAARWFFPKHDVNEGVLFKRKVGGKDRWVSWYSGLS